MKYEEFLKIMKNERQINHDPAAEDYSSIYNICENVEGFYIDDYISIEEMENHLKENEINLNDLNEQDLLEILEDDFYLSDYWNEFIDQYFIYYSDLKGVSLEDAIDYIEDSYMLSKEDFIKILSNNKLALLTLFLMEYFYI